MRHGQALAIHRAAAVEDDVQVDRSRPESDAAVDAPELSLHALERVEEFNRIGPDVRVVHARDERGVQEDGLVRDVRGRGLVQRRVALDCGGREEGREGGREGGTTA
jgi:hypothetical protein